ncbi:hypothetical protein EJ08DRAFT_667754 [Tothia fuscella]|uniref:Vezatin n=1 Tax=Tothia fuscella TaxID=1048955 RepID=A0A9P4P217_9PEZI|nr:hypothetical protein EJ08DRAFT_667754 [Tothia fuscella]
MEALTYEDSPLAQYLEESPPSPAKSSPRRNGRKESFAPSNRVTVNKVLPQPLRLSIPTTGPVAKIHEVCSRAVNSRLGRADNAKFLEHFRYVLISSQLLSEQQNNANNRSSFVPNLHSSGAHLEEYRVTATSVTGVLTTATTSFAAVWLVHWAKNGRLNQFSKGRVLVVISAFLLLAIVLYAYAKRQWLQYLRQNAVTAGSTLITNLQAFEASSSAALTLVQEVELVSRGYRISLPLPPVTRMDEKNPVRRCSKLRKCLRGAYAANLSPFREACNYMKGLISEDDLERYLEVYDVSSMDIEEARQGYTLDEFDDLESLKALRIFQARLSILRRVFLCSLLSLEANGGKPDYPRWRIAVDSMERLASTTGEWAEQLNALLAEEEQFLTPSTPLHKSRHNDPERDRVRSQIRKLGSLSTGIRGLQAKLQILREESVKSLDENDDFSDLGPSLMVQYDSIGNDLKSLVHSWEHGKASLALNIDRRESRRISQASSGLRSPVPSLGGLTAVDESHGSPTDALRALNGETPNQAKSNGSASSGSPTRCTSDEEVFEAIAIPKTRNSLSLLTREQRIAKMQEERDRMASFKDRQEQGMSMIRELESVISLRPAADRRSKRASMGRFPVHPI